MVAVPRRNSDGFDAIALLSRGSVLGVVLTSLFFDALRSGANVMQRSTGVPVTIISAIQELTVRAVGK